VCPRFLSIVTALSLIQYILLAVNTGITAFHDPKLLRTKILFGIGLALSLVQYVLMPRMLKLYNGMMDKETGDEEAWEMLDKWLRINNWRIWGMELPALAAAFGAVVNTL